MKKYIFSIGLLSLLSTNLSAQSAFDLYSLAQTDLRGTARFMSMAGAFGALGGDMSTLNQNPGGIGIYRSSEIGVTLDWNIKNTLVENNYKTKDTNFNLNNIGYIGSFKTGIEALPNINWGFTYAKTASFNRRYAGGIDGIVNSMTNYIANQSKGWLDSELGAVKGGHNPYQDSNAPWMSILAYNSYLINPSNATGDRYAGLFRQGTSGFGELEVEENGQIDEYSISIGGNALNKVYWGATVGITDLNYNLYSYYGEALDDAYVPYYIGNSAHYGSGSASWGMENIFRMTGTGVNFKLGAIFKPVNEFRIGVAFHTPTFFSVRSEYVANTAYAFNANNPLATENIAGDAITDEGYVGETHFEAKTPWKFMGSIAGVIGGRGILSFDYERIMYDGMRVSYDWHESSDVTDNVKQYFKPSNIFRIGGEFKVTPQFSIRAGYSYQTSPATEEIKDDMIDVVTAGTTLSYTLDNSIRYITAGLGYRYKAFYADLAYLHKTRNSDYHAFSSEANEPLPPMAAVKDSNNEIAVTLGFKF